MIRRRHDPNLHRPEDSVCGGHSLFHVIPVTDGMGNRRRLAEAGYEVGGDRPEPALTEVQPHGSLAVYRRATGNRGKDGKLLPRIRQGPSGLQDGTHRMARRLLLRLIRQFL